MIAFITVLHITVHYNNTQQFARGVLSNTKDFTCLCTMWTNSGFAVIMKIVEFSTK